MYNPQAFEGGGQGPVSGSVAKAGYATTALNALDAAYKQKIERQGKQLQEKLTFDDAQVAEAQANQQKYAKDPQLADKYTQDYADALKERDKTKDKLKKHYGIKDNMWSAIWQKINAHGQGTQPQTAGGPPKPVGMSPTGQKASQEGPNAAIPIGSKEEAKTADYITLRTNFDLAQAIANGANAEELARIDKNKNDLLMSQQDQQKAQIGRQQTYTATVAQVAKDIVKTMPANLPEKLPGAISQWYDAAAAAWPVGQAPKGPDGKVLPDQEKAYAMAPAEHVISALNAWRQRPEMKDQLPWIEGKLSEFHKELEGIATEYAKTPPKPLTLGKTERSAYDRTPGAVPGLPPGEQSPEWQTAYQQNLTKVIAEEDQEKQQHTKLEDARLKEILARAKHLSRIGSGGAGHGGRPGTPKNPMDDVLMQINRGVGMAFKGVYPIDIKAERDKAEEIAQQIIDGNDDLLAQKSPNESYLDFVYRMIGQNVNSPSAAPPVPSGSADFSALPQAAQDYLKGRGEAPAK